MLSLPIPKSKPKRSTIVFDDSHLETLCYIHTTLDSDGRKTEWLAAGAQRI